MNGWLSQGHLQRQTGKTFWADREGEKKMQSYRIDRGVVLGRSVKGCVGRSRDGIQPQKLR